MIPTSTSGFYAVFFGGGGKNDAHGAMPPGGMWRICPPRKFLKWMCSEVTSGGFWGLKEAGN